MIAEELLINFRELVREHSGENLAHAVYNTLNLYSLKGHVITINADNASNNNTMVEHRQLHGYGYHGVWVGVCLSDTPAHIHTPKVGQGWGYIPTWSWVCTPCGYRWI